MKPNEQVLERIENLGDGDYVELGIDAKSLKHIERLLTRVYTDPLLAALREPASNAYDSHQEAGNSAPIEVTLPSALDPHLVIQDYGTGMSKETILTIYSMYGASTKRETNEQVGMLGIGCKSPIAYADQFTIISIHNGVRILALFSRKAEGGGFIKIKDERPTDEPNGVTVKIPINERDYESLKKKAKRFFSFWETGTVLLDGVEPERIKGEWFDEGVLITDIDQYTNSDIVVMGGTPYAIPQEFDISRNYLQGKSKRLVMFVPIGTVDPKPDRESLELTLTTKEFLTDVKKWFEGGIVIKAQKEIDEAPSFAEAREVYERWVSTVSYYRRGIFSSLRYRGIKIPSEPSYHLNKRHGDTRGYLYTISSYGHEDQFNTIDTNINYDLSKAGPSLVLVKNYPNKTMSRSFRDRFNPWIKIQVLTSRQWKEAQKNNVLSRNEPYNIHVYLFSPGHFEEYARWANLGDALILDWAKIIDLIPPAVKEEKPVQKAVTKVKADVDHIVFYHSKDVNRGDEWDLRGWVERIGNLLYPKESFKAPKVDGRTVDRFLEEHPDAVHICDWHQQLHLAPIWDKVPDEVLATLMWTRDSNNYIDWSYASLIKTLTDSDDPDFAKVESYKQFRSLSEPILFSTLKCSHSHREIGNQILFEVAKLRGITVKNTLRVDQIFERYPLLKGVRDHVTHAPNIIEYVNLKYQADTKKKTSKAA